MEDIVKSSTNNNEQHIKINLIFDFIRENKSAILYLLIFYIWFIYKNGSFSVFSYGVSLYELMGGGFLIANIFSQNLRVILNNFNQLIQSLIPCCKTKSSEYNLQLIKLLNHIKCKTESDEDLKNDQCKIILYLKNQYEDDFLNNRDQKIYSKRIKENIEKVWNVEKLTVQQIKFNPKIEKVLSLYDDQVAKQIQNFYIQCLISSEIKARKNIIYLYGPPGVGKTYLVNQLKNVFELPLVTISNSKKLKNNSVEDIIKNMCGISNSIIFVDEFDKMEYHSDFRTFILNLCGQNEYQNIKLDQIYSYVTYLFKLQNPIIILAGNKVPHDEAILSRVPIIKFESISKEKKKEIYLNYIKTEISHYLGFEKYSNLNSLHYNSHEKLIDEIIEKDTSEGVRVGLDILDKYIIHLLTFNIIPETFILPFSVDEILEQYKVANNEDDKYKIVDLKTEMKEKYL